MADRDFEVLNGQFVIEECAHLDEPSEPQFDLFVPQGLKHEPSGSGDIPNSVRVVPLLIRTVP